MLLRDLLNLYHLLKMLRKQMTLSKEGTKAQETNKDPMKPQVGSKTNLGSNTGLGKLLEKEKFSKDRIAELVANNKISKSYIIRNKLRSKMKLWIKFQLSSWTIIAKNLNNSQVTSKKSSSLSPLPNRLKISISKHFLQPKHKEDLNPFNTSDIIWCIYTN